MGGKGRKGWKSNMNWEAVYPVVVTCPFCVATTEYLILVEMEKKVYLLDL